MGASVDEAAYELQALKMFIRLVSKRHVRTLRHIPLPSNLIFQERSSLSCRRGREEASQDTVTLYGRVLTQFGEVRWKELRMQGCLEELRNQSGCSLVSSPGLTAEKNLSSVTEFALAALTDCPARALPLFRLLLLSIWSPCWDRGPDHPDPRGSPAPDPRVPLLSHLSLPDARCSSASLPQTMAAGLRAGPPSAASSPSWAARAAGCRLPPSRPAGAPRLDGAAPRLDGAAPRLDGAAPRLDGAAPRLDGAAPRLDGAAPRLDGAAPRLDGAAPRLDGAAPRLDGAAPRLDGAAPRLDGAAPRLDGAAPRLDGAAPRLDGAAPRLDGAAPRLDGAAAVTRKARLPPLLEMTRGHSATQERAAVAFAGSGTPACMAAILAPCLLTVMAATRSPCARGRAKTFSTCTARLTAVSLLFGTLIFMYLRGHSGRITTAIPMLNPLIYSLRNKEVLEALRKVLNRASVS
ncbi:hypothetical protein AB1E18_010888 [Capra hircus]